MCVWHTWWIVVWGRKHAETAWPLQADSGSENGGLWREVEVCHSLYCLQGNMF